MGGPKWSQTTRTYANVEARAGQIQKRCCSRKGLSLLRVGQSKPFDQSAAEQALGVDSP